MAIVIRMPEVITGMAEAALLEWHVQPGDDVAVGQPLAEVETEKATVEYAAEEAGTLAGVLVKAGAQVSVGTPIAVLASAGETAEQALAAADVATSTTEAAPAAETAPAEPSQAETAAADASPTPVPAAASTPDATASEAAVSAPAVSEPQTGRLFASPLVRRLAKDRGLDLSGVRGSGPGGRIVRRDLDGLTAPAASVPVATVETAARPGGFSDTPHTGMRRAIARRLTESKSTVPHFYLVADCRVDALLELRRSINEVHHAKISVNDFVVKAAASAFRDVPAANAIWTDTATRQFDDVDIAIAVAIDGGLITPVVRRVDKRSLGDISADMRDLAERAREGRLKQAEIEGGSFSISNLGMYGTREFSAIINPPHAGILAVGAATQRPVVVDGELVVATVMTVTLSADHRVLDGALAAEWLAAFVRRIEHPASILV